MHGVFYLINETNMKRISYLTLLALCILVVHDTIVVLGIRSGGTRLSGQTIQVITKDCALYQANGMIKIDVPHVSELPCTPEILSAVSKGVVMASNGNVYVKIRIGGYTRRLFSFVPNTRWVSLTELCGIIDPDCLILTGEKLDDQLNLFIMLRNRAKKYDYITSNGAWKYGAIASMEAVHYLLQSESE